MPRWLVLLVLAEQALDSGGAVRSDVPLAMVVRNGWRASLAASAGPTAVPALGEVSLLALAIMLAAWAVLRRR